MAQLKDAQKAFNKINADLNNAGININKAERNLIKAGRNLVIKQEAPDNLNNKAINNAEKQVKNAQNILEKLIKNRQNIRITHVNASRKLKNVEMKTRESKRKRKAPTKRNTKRLAVKRDQNARFPLQPNDPRIKRFEVRISNTMPDLTTNTAKRLAAILTYVSDFHGIKNAENRYLDTNVAVKKLGKFIRARNNANTIDNKTLMRFVSTFNDEYSKPFKAKAKENAKVRATKV